MVYNQLKGEKGYILLRECGHAPIEEPGIFTMEEETLRFINEKSND